MFYIYNIKLAHYVETSTRVVGPVTQFLEIYMRYINGMSPVH